MSNFRKLDSIFQGHLTRYCLVYLILLIALIIGFSLILFFTEITNKSDSIKLVGGSMAILAVIFTGLQFRAHHDWNRRQIALTSAREEKTKITKDISRLDRIFNYRERNYSEGDYLTLDEINNALYGKKNQDGKYEENEEIKKSILSVLNAFEYISTGIVQGIFDEEVIYKLYAGPLLRAYYVFNKYIDELNTSQQHRKGKIYENLQDVAKGFKKREILEDHQNPRRPSPGPIG